MPYSAKAWCCWERLAWLIVPWVPFCLPGVQAAGVTQPASASELRAPALGHADDCILVQPKPGASRKALARLHSAEQGKVLRTFDSMGGLQVVALPAGEAVPAFIAKYQKSGLVEFAEPDYIGHLAAIPNDTYYTNATLWGLDKIEAPAAWAVLNAASNIVVAVLDTGVRYTHEDLASNMWVNPTDGGHGWNALTGTNNPADDSGHGTLVAGVLGAVGNNGKGVVGVAWRVQIMACKCFNNFGVGKVSDAVTCLDYARSNGAHIVNASWGFTNSLALSNAVSALRDAGVIVVAACGNGATPADLDVNPVYPAGYHLDNVVSVAFTTRSDTLAATSNYGTTNVHLAAPGEQITSTFGAGDTGQFAYFTDSGTSFAAPYVAGACALLLAEYPGESHQQIINRILSTTDPLPSLAGKCATGGRLNLRKALTPIRLTAIAPATNGPFQLRLSAATNMTCVVQVSTNLTSWHPLVTNTTSTAGTFDFTDAQSTNFAQRFYRAVASP
jgi:subtilisin family serine protease